MKNRNNKSKAKKKGEKGGGGGGDDAFGCDLTQHLQSSGHGVPQVLKACAEFIEEHGVVDGIYRLSGVTSNIQRLRQEFCSEVCPDLSKEVYLQDIHCVGSLCKLYFRELPNPLLTYQLYSRFTELVSVQGDQEKLVHVQKVIRDLPDSHFRTLEYLTRHLAHLATFSSQTNMHTRNLALVWAPNLLRCKDIEASSANGDMAFQEVRIQQSVVEFILRHTEQIFSGETLQTKPREGGSSSVMCGEKYATLPLGSPMKLMSLEEAQARSLSPNHPLHPQRQRENSLPDTSTTTLYHTALDITDKRKFSSKSKRWKSIFNLGRSGESKGKLSRNGSVFIRAQSGTEKAPLRPSRSMESLCSLTNDDERTGSPSGGAGSIFIPGKKSRTLGTDSLYEHDWDARETKDGGRGCGGRGGAAASWSSGVTKGESPGASNPPQKSLPEQLKVFKGDEIGGYKPTSPKNRRMLYSGSGNSSSSRPSFPGNFFPLESSPRHQRRAVNISEPFAVSVPLRVSAVISSNSTPCRAHAKEKAATLKPPRETLEQSGGVGKSNTVTQQEVEKQEEEVRRNEAEINSRVPLTKDTEKQVLQETQGEKKTISELESLENTSEATLPSAGREENSPQEDTLLEKASSSGEDLWSKLSQELRISEPEIDFVEETVLPVFHPSAYESSRLTMEVKSKRSRSSPSLSLLCQEQTTQTRKQPSESDIFFSLHKHSVLPPGKMTNIDREKKLELKLLPAENEEAGHVKLAIPPLKGTREEEAVSSLTVKGVSVPGSVSVAGNSAASQEAKLHQEDIDVSDVGAERSEVPDVDLVQRLTACLEEGCDSAEPANLEEDDGGGGEGNWEELDLLESWEDLHAAQQWVTSPLHSPDLDELFNHLPPFGCHAEAAGKAYSSSTDGRSNFSETFAALQTFSESKPDANERILRSAATRLTGKSSPVRQKNVDTAPHRFNRQLSHESAVTARKEESPTPFRLRPCSLNLDLRPRYIRDISNQQDRRSSEFPSAHRRPAAASVSSISTATSVPSSDLQLFLSQRQAPQRRNSAPVSVSSVRTAFMIKTCQAKAVPVIPPKVQYSQIPNAGHGKDGEAAKDRERERTKTTAEKTNSAPPPTMSDLKEELENKEPTPKPQRHSSGDRGADGGRKVTTPEQPVTTRRRQPNLEVFVDAPPRSNKAALLQRPSFRNRQRPQSLILLSPPFPIMDYPSSHPSDDTKLLSPIRSLNDTTSPAVSVFSKDGADGIQNKMTIPKSGQRLETSTSCFYQPQRRSLIYDGGRGHRQIE